MELTNYQTFIIIVEVLVAIIGLSYAFVFVRDNILASYKERTLRKLQKQLLKKNRDKQLDKEIQETIDKLYEE